MRESKNSAMPIKDKENLDRLAEIFKNSGEWDSEYDGDDTVIVKHRGARASITLKVNAKDGIECPKARPRE